MLGKVECFKRRPACPYLARAAGRIDFFFFIRSEPDLVELVVSDIHDHYPFRIDQLL